MFADTFSDSPRTGWRRAWTTLASFALETLAILLLPFIPLFSMERLPQPKVVLGLGPAAPLAPPEKTSQLPHKSAVNPVTGAKRPLFVPSSIPCSLTSSPATTPRPPLPLGFGLDDTLTRLGIAHSRAAGVWGSIGVEASTVAPPPPRPVAHPSRQSVIMEGYLLERVNPPYPELARIARIEGTVRLRALISKEGTIENLRVLSGQPLLVEATLQAVRRWRYRPYVLNGEKVEVETEITVSFVLSDK